MADGIKIGKRNSDNFDYEDLIQAAKLYGDSAGKFTSNIAGHRMQGEGRPCTIKERYHINGHVFYVVQFQVANNSILCGTYHESELIGLPYTNDLIEWLMC